MSKLDALLDMLKTSGADELRLVVDDKLHIVRDGRRQDVGREPLSAKAVQALALDLVTPDELRACARQPKTVNVKRNGEGYDVVLGASSAGTLTIRMRRAAEAAPQRRAPTQEEAPASRGAYVSLPPDALMGNQAPGVAVPPPARTGGAAVAGVVTPGTVPAVAQGGGGGMAGGREMGGGAMPMGRPAIDDLLKHMIDRQASDLHLSPGVVPALRVHGEMVFLRDRQPLSGEAITGLLGPIMSAKVRKEFEEGCDADFAHEIPGVARFRVNAFQDRIGTGAVFRQIPYQIVPADKLGLPKPVLDLCFLTKGLVLVTGPTGSGKSTTLASMIDHINRNRSDHIITIEDPVEFVHQNNKCLVNQREVGLHTKSFKRALRAALREDPDVVLVGEMRDLETIAIAIETAETGHLVFGTLHTTTATSTVDRIIDQFPPDQQAQVRVMLSESLKGVVAQVLCKRVGGGRVAAMEILLGTNAVASLIREGKTFQIPSIMQTSRGMGMVTMNDSLLALVQAKLVTPQEAMMKAVDKSGLTAQFKNNNIALTP